MRINMIIFVSIIFLCITNFTFTNSSRDAVAAATGCEIFSFGEGGEVKFADVRPGEDNWVHFNLTANGGYFKDKNVSKIICTPEFSVKQRFYSGKTVAPMGWQITPENIIIELKPDERRAFEVGIKVPAETSFYSTGELIISGTARTLPDNRLYSIDELTGIIRISYYDNWKLSARKLTQTVTRGDTVVFEVSLFNMGNGRDIFFQSIENDNDLVKSDITFEFPINIELDEKTTTKFDVLVKTSEKTPKGDYVVELCSQPTDIDATDNSGNRLYCINLLLVVEKDTLDRIMMPSAIIFVIIIIIIFVKLVKSNKKKHNNLGVHAEDDTHNSKHALDGY